MYIQYIQGLFQSRLGTADYALVTSSIHYNDSLSNSHYDQQSVGQPVLVSGAHLGPVTNFFFLLEIFL
jgi:hypothetical protein